MKSLISILMLFSLFFSNPVFSINCPEKYKSGEIEKIYELLMENRKLQLTDAWKNLSSSTKQTCEILLQERIDKYSKQQDKKREISKKTFGLSDLTNVQIILLTLGVLLAFSIIINFTDFIKKRKDKIKEPSKLQGSNPIHKNKLKFEPKEEKPKKILTWDEPIKAEPKKEEPVKKEIKSSEVTITPQEEEAIYTQVAKELQENRNEGVWLKAYTENDGDETKTKIAYTKKRVTALIEELKVKKQNEKKI